jgi:hypothetical protein
MALRQCIHLGEVIFSLAHEMWTFPLESTEDEF